jgi:exosortase/archaeosortase family protein
MKLFNILARYLLILVLFVPNLWFFYLVFTPPTVYLLYLLFNIFFGASFIGSNIILVAGSVPVELIKACIAGSAYALLFLLNMSVPDIKIKKRIIMVAFSFLILLILNIARIFVLTLFFIKNYSFFDEAHKLFWYVISSVFIVLIWFLEVKLFRIKDIPVYSDLKIVLKAIKKKS